MDYDDDHIWEPPIPSSGTKSFGRGLLPMSANPRFKTLIELLGASYADAAAVLGIALQTVNMKCVGSRSVRASEMTKLRDLWVIVRAGRIDDLPTDTPESIRKRTELIRDIESEIL